ncbi:MAG: hypothetical protein DYH12_31275 [Sorangiineae bacterium PRO1]|nr:hypothetical protein [Sorangiineae bacterium PRO1]
MHETESDELTQCEECGAEVAPARDRAFVYSDENVLCYGCSVKRGGAWDALHERWEKTPDLTGLPDARRPHS